MTISSIALWFKEAVPEPNEKNFNTQIGCHLEELHEMLFSLEGSDIQSDDALVEFRNQVLEFADKCKQGEFKLSIVNRVDFLDSICDQIVTGVGASVYQGMDVSLALKEVTASNWSKFVDGKPIFDDNKKIQKGRNYFKPNLEQYV